MGLVKVRLQGTPAAVEAAAAQLRAALRVLEESADYANRGASAYVRRYIELEVDIEPAGALKAVSGPEIEQAAPPAIVCPQCGAAAVDCRDERPWYYTDEETGLEHEGVIAILVCARGHAFEHIEK